MTANVDLARLQRSLEWGLERSLADRELVLMLRPLVRATQVHTEPGSRARLYLAERLLRSEPNVQTAWEAACLCRAVLAHCYNDARNDGEGGNHEEQARAEGALGLSYTVLGQFRAARAAYRRALRIDPGDGVVAHNLGHLEIVQFNRPKAGLHWLGVAHRLLAGDPEVAASFAHALVKAGNIERARAVLLPVCCDASQVEVHLQRWRKA